ncbi:hypothetical protein GQ600_347 [Phytophthora cactorum]|nr:hypothetical protein GQ600_347 [Phytophthora cactorum]
MDESFGSRYTSVRWYHSCASTPRSSICCPHQHQVSYHDDAATFYQVCAVVAVHVTRLSLSFARSPLSGVQYVARRVVSAVRIAMCTFDSSGNFHFEHDRSRQQRRERILTVEETQRQLRTPQKVPSVSTPLTKPNNTMTISSVVQNGFFQDGNQLSHNVSTN